MFFYLFSQILNFYLDYSFYNSRDSESLSESESDSELIFILDDILDIDDNLFYSEN